MKPKTLTPNVAVNPQIQVEDLGELAKLGFRSIIGNRPDGEVPGQPTWSGIAAAAADHGLQTRHVPVVASSIGDEDVAAFGDAVRDLPGPIMAFCRTGMRSVILWAMANKDVLAPEERLEIAKNAGYDITPFRGQLGPDFPC